MSQLAKLQADFQAYLLDDTQGASFIKSFVDDKKVGAKKRLGIYHDAYRLRIIEALATAYPQLNALLGDVLFDNTAREYITAVSYTHLDVYKRQSLGCSTPAFLALSACLRRPFKRSFTSTFLASSSAKAFLP